MHMKCQRLLGRGDSRLLGLCSPLKNELKKETFSGQIKEAR